MGLFDIIKIYKSEWQEVSKRKFDDKEVALIDEAIVVASKYGKSVCFSIIGKGKGFLPLEPIAKVEIGDKLDPAKLELVDLKYIGDSPNQTKKQILRVRVPNEEDTLELVDFNNPFGI